MPDTEKILEEIEAWMGDIPKAVKGKLKRHIDEVLDNLYNEAWDIGYEKGYSNGLYDGDGKE